MSDEPLEQELILLGRELQTAQPPDDLAESVLSRIAAQPDLRRRSAPRARWWRSFARSRKRLVAVIIATVIIALALTPPVRAAVTELLRLGGIIVRSAPAAPVSSSPRSPEPPGAPVSGEMTLAEARAAVPFDLVVPEELGSPGRVTVSSDHRVVGMDWGTGAARIHLDQFDGAMSYAFIKQWWKELEMIKVLDRDAVWFDAPHTIIYVDDDGTEHTADARLSGPSLVFQRGGSSGDVTLRLEGDLSRSRAVKIAESVRP